MADKRWRWVLSLTLSDSEIKVLGSIMLEEIVVGQKKQLNTQIKVYILGYCWKQNGKCLCEMPRKGKCPRLGNLSNKVAAMHQYRIQLKFQSSRMR